MPAHAQTRKDHRSMTAYNIHFIFEGQAVDSAMSATTFSTQESSKTSHGERMACHVPFEDMCF
jgi:hypothetical protein